MTTGALFQPEVISLLQLVLEDATETLPKAKRTSAIKADMAVAILASAAAGERNPTALKTAAISAVTDPPQYYSDLSEDRRAG